MSKTGLKRIITDKFYTKDNIAKNCIEILKQKISIEEYNIILEPSAGAGVFIEPFIGQDYKIIAYDIAPNHNLIIKNDFLSINKLHCKIKDKILVIGNPPFGRQSSIAKKFIKKCCQYKNIEVIAFILPKSFKKDSFKKTFPLKFHLISETDLPNNSFIIDGEEYNVPCVFQIWKLKNINRIEPIKVYPIGYKIVKKKDNPDISFRRVGVYAGKIDTHIIDKSIQSHYFITFDNKFTLQYIVDNYKHSMFNHNNTVGAKSISQQEMITVFNTILASK